MQKTEKLKNENIKYLYTKVVEKKNKWSEKIQSHQENNKRYENEVKMNAKRDFEKWQGTLTQLQKRKEKDVFKDPSPNKKQPTEIVAENISLAKARELEPIMKSKNDYKLAQNDLNGLSEKLSKGAERYSKLKNDKVTLVNERLNYVEEINEYAQELTEKRNYDNLNKVVMKDKKFNKTI
jgi:hypothetical protein